MKISTDHILSDLIGLDSRYTQTNRPVVDYVAHLLASKAQIKTYKYTHNGLEFYNLVAKIKGKKSTSPACLVGHTDTVEICSGWKSDPLVARLANGKIAGLGASDMKGAIAGFLSAILSVDKPAQDTYLILDADEEGEGSGGRKIINKLGLKNARFIIGEPTNLQIRTGQKGAFTLEVTLIGQGGHGGMASYQNNLTNSAIHRANRLLSDLINDEPRLAKIKHKIHGTATQNIGLISGGSSSNTISDKCVFTVERRFPPDVNLKAERSALLKKIRLYKGVKIRDIFWGEAFTTSSQGALVQQLSSILGKKNTVQSGLGWTEAGLFQRFGECVIFGPGQSDQAHQANEYITANNLSYYEKTLKIWLVDTS